MSLLSDMAAVLALATKRLLAKPLLTAASVLGLLVPVTFLVAVPIYTESAYARLLQAELGKVGSAEPGSMGLTFHYLGSWAGPVRWSQAEPLDRYIADSISDELGLHVQFGVRFLRTSNVGLYPIDTTHYDSLRTRLAAIRFATITDLESQIVLTEGDIASLAVADPQSPIEAFVSEALAAQLGLSPGEDLMAAVRQGERYTEIPVHIAGVWRARDPKDPYWFRDPALLDQTLLVSEEAFLGQLATHLEHEIHEALWYIVVDSSGVGPGQASDLISRLRRIESVAGSLLPGVVLESPLPILQNYLGRERLLATTLLVYALPVVGLGWLFIALVARVIIEHERREIATLVSRGASRFQIVAEAAVEGLMIGFVVLACAVPLGAILAGYVGRTRTFLEFATEDYHPTLIGSGAYALSALGILFGLLSRMVPVLAATRETVVTYNRRHDGNQETPGWRTLTLDLALLTPAVYGLWLLQQGGLERFADASLGVSPAQNPLLFLAPFLAMLYATLLLSRLVPVLMRLVAWGSSQGRSVSLFLAAQQLARAPRHYGPSLGILLAALALAGFVSSSAVTLDERLYRLTEYRAGASVRVVPRVDVGSSPSDRADELSTGASRGDVIPQWYFVPAQAYQELDGVRQAARVAAFPASTTLRGGQSGGTLMGVDRDALAEVAYWEGAFADQSLQSLMNALARSPDAILVPTSFLRTNALGLGDSVRLTIAVYGQSYEIVGTVAGAFYLFPTWNPQGGPLYVGNIAYLSEQVGVDLPASVWLSVESDALEEDLKEAIHALNPYASVRTPNYQHVIDQQRRPERQGLFGMLSAGFLAMATLAIMGFAIYLAAGFRGRVMQIGVLRALGLSTRETALCLLWEMAALVLTGLIGGTLIGYGASSIFVPYLSFEVDALARLIPTVVRFDWRILHMTSGTYLLFLGICFIGAIQVLKRSALFKTIKLMEVMQ